MPLSTRPARLAAGIGAATAGAAVGTGAASVAGAAYFARKVLTPDRRRPNDTRILAVSDAEISLEVTPETAVDGRYGLWFDDGAGHLRLGEILTRDGTHVRRRLEGVDSGVPAPGAARWDGYYYVGPPEVSLGIPTEHVLLESEVGSMPAWLIPGADPRRWAILVHGRGATREECLRAVAPLRSARHTCLIPAYRNDADAPAGPDGRYNLGLSEWRDIETAIAFALRRGAGTILLLGWSMGGAIILQTLDRSPLASRVTAAILDGPVVDWADVLRHHARAHHVPEPIHRLSRTLMGRSWSRRLVGVHEAVDVARTDWVTRAAELRTPMLIVHSADDEFVPSGPSRRLAQARPDLVTWVAWDQARHCKEWNTDPERWEAVVAGYVEELVCSA